MQEPLFTDDILPWIDKAYNWVLSVALTWDVLLQVAIMLAVAFASWLFAIKAAAWGEAHLRKKEGKHLLHHVGYREAAFLFFAVVLIWIAVLIGKGAGLPHQAMEVIASLVTAWGVIRLTSSTIRSRFWSQTIAIILWAVAALNIVGLLDYTVNLLDHAAITIGKVNLSLLLVFKGIIAFGVLFWAVNFLSDLLERIFQKSSGLTGSQKVLFHKLSKIFLFTVATLMGLNIIGIDLTALTVFSGALGLGIGFGLQKVFSNLISGIILLIDKSVKPGDVIVVGDTFGWVNSLSARYVSVITRDGKEHLIPNENLITQEVENWSYTDDRVRVHIPVGISYHSDIHKARELMLAVVGNHPRILKVPAPNCLILNFGEFSVNHDLRVWIRDPEQGVGNIRSDIYYALWDAFKENGIQIPFPQRDIYIKTMPDTLAPNLSPREKTE